MTNKALMAVMNLLPENTLVDSHDIIPGLDDVSGKQFWISPLAVILTPDSNCGIEHSGIIYKRLMSR